MAHETRIAVGPADLVMDIATGQQKVQANLEMANVPIDDANPLPVKLMSGAAQKSSDVTPKATTSDAPVEVIAADPVNTYYHLRIFNSGTVAGFYSFDGGTTWHYLPAASSLAHDGVKIANKAVQIKRVAGGSNVTGVFASLW